MPTRLEHRVSETPDDVIDLPELDEPPKGGYWAPEVLDIEATAEEIAEGNRLGDLTREQAT